MVKKLLLFYILLIGLASTLNAILIPVEVIIHNAYYPDTSFRGLIDINLETNSIGDILVLTNDIANEFGATPYIKSEIKLKIKAIGQDEIAYVSLNIHSNQPRWDDPNNLFEKITDEIRKEFNFDLGMLIEPLEMHIKISRN